MFLTSESYGISVSLAGLESITINYDDPRDDDASIEQHHPSRGETWTLTFDYSDDSIIREFSSGDDTLSAFGELVKDSGDCLKEFLLSRHGIVVPKAGVAHIVVNEEIDSRVPCALRIYYDSGRVIHQAFDSFENAIEAFRDIDRCVKEIDVESSPTEDDIPF